VEFLGVLRKIYLILGCIKNSLEDGRAGDIEHSDFSQDFEMKNMHSIGNN